MPGARGVRRLAERCSQVRLRDQTELLLVTGSDALFTALRPRPEPRLKRDGGEILVDDRSSVVASHAPFVHSSTPATADVISLTTDVRRDGLWEDATFLRQTGQSILGGRVSTQNALCLLSECIYLNVSPRY